METLERSILAFVCLRCDLISVSLRLQLDPEQTGKVTLEMFKKWWFRGEENKIPYIWHPDMTREELEKARCPPVPTPALQPSACAPCKKVE